MLLRPHRHRQPYALNHRNREDMFLFQKIFFDDLVGVSVLEDYRTAPNMVCLIQHCRLPPFGLKNAVSAFQQLMTQVFRGENMEYMLVYIDDILIYSKSFEEHLEESIEMLTH